MIAALALLLLANPLDVYGFGARAAALGGAATAAVDDTSAGYYNPAALARLGTLRLDFGGMTAAPSFRIGGASAEVPSLTGMLAGLAIPGRALGHRVAFGLSLDIPGGDLFKVHTTAADVPRVVWYDNRPHRLFLAANAAVEVLPGLYAGGGVALLSRSQGQVSLQGNVALTHPSESALLSSIDVGLFGVRYPQAGLLWEVSPRLSLGLTYRHSFRLEIDQRFRVTGSLGDPGQAALVAQGFFEAQTHVRDLFQPAQLALGAAVHATARLLLTADVTYERWRDFPVAPLPGIALDLGPLLTPLVNLPPPVEPAPADFHDLFVPRLGAELRVLETSSMGLDVRAGYAFEASPAPAGSATWADGDKHTFSAGAGVALHGLQPVLRGSLGLDLYAAYTLVPARQGTEGNVLQAGATARLRF